MCKSRVIIANVMTTVTILPEKTNLFRAVANGKESLGRTAGEALDAITNQLGEDAEGTILVIQTQKADKFFTVEQQSRMSDLMELRQANKLTEIEEKELETLIKAELQGATKRANLTLIDFIITDKLLKTITL